MTENIYAPTAWGAKTAFLDLTVPSGQVCQVRQPGVENLLAAGVLENADTLMSIVNQKVDKAKGKAPKKPTVDTAKIMDDPKKVVSVFALIDRVVEYMVVQPAIKRPVVRTPKDDAPGEFNERPMLPEERDQATIYTDSIDLGDRMFIFQYAIGGGDDIESFREKFSEGLGSLAAQ